MVLTAVEKKFSGFNLNIEKLAISKPGIYGLVGCNGCGKSTLAKIMAGLLRPDSGRIDSEGLTSRDITFLGRKPYMMDDTVYNNLVYPLKLRNTAIDKNKIELFIDKMKLSNRIKQRAKSLSSGEQQKLSFLRAVIFKPKLIIADEAMTAMDLDSLDLFEKTIIEEQKNENSIWIIISHQIPHIRFLCDYIYFMYDGKIEYENNAHDFFTKNNNPLVKQYLRTYN
ncbi:MAG: ATP-binding cassette domain-containing protein [Treponema sp.]|nr:ATP-binding cassette domain-containing protein [Treponema sp.]